VNSTDPPGRATGAGAGDGTAEGLGATGGLGAAGDVWLRSVRIRGDEFPVRDRYPFSVPAFQHSQELHFSQSIAFLVGENGSGKSTLIEAIARRCGFHIWAQPKRNRAPVPLGPGPPAPGCPPSGPAGAPRAGAAALSEYLDVTLARASVKGGVFSAESFREWAEFIDDVAEIDPGQARYHGGQMLTLRSRGEGLLAYFRGRYQVPGLYFLDEPEAALSPASQLELLRLLADYRTRGHAQFVIATHSPLLMALRGAQVFLLDGGSIVETTYEGTSHYRLYRDFMADPGRFTGE
jgi:predicted ATPase